jgi:hypothetical protein
MSSPAISVVLPVHDVAPWLRECLSSLLDDQDVDLEVIAVDDASTDDGWVILAERAAVDPRLRPVRNPGTGGAAARNHGVGLARGEFLAFVDGDDLVPRGAYRSMLDAARGSGSQLVVGSFLKFFPTRTWRPTTPWPAFAKERRGVTLVEQPSLIRNRACWNRLFRRDFWLDEGITFPSVPRSNDVVPMTRALVAARSIDVVLDTVYLYRARPGATSMSARAHGAENFVSYLGQEQQSLALTSSLGDPGLRALHESLFAVNDGWVHLQTFLSGAGFVDCTEAELADVRRELAALHAELAPATIEKLSTERYWGFELAVAGAWDDARSLVLADEAPDPAAMLAVADRLGSGAPVDAPVDLDRLRQLVERFVLRPLCARTEPAADLAPVLVKSRDLFARLYADGASGSLPAGPQHLVRVLLSGDDDALVRVLAEAPLQVSLREVTADRAGSVAHLVRQGPDGQGPAGRGLGFHLVSRSVRREVRSVELGDAGSVTVRLPLRRMAARNWTLRFTTTVDGVPIDAPVALAPGAPRTRIVHGHRVILRQPVQGEDRARIDVGGSRARRAARRAWHAARRRGLTTPD